MYVAIDAITYVQMLLSTLLYVLALKGVMCTHTYRKHHPRHVSKRVKESSFIVQNDCSSEDIFIHVMSISGRIQSQNNVESTIYNVPDSLVNITNTRLLENESQDFLVIFEDDTESSTSTWRLWWDSNVNSTGSQNQTLVESTCVVYDSSELIQHCWTDVSLVDGLTSSVKVDFVAENNPPIVVKPPDTWECPIANRLNYTSLANAPRPFLTESQACLSNCSLYRTESTCCLGDYTAATCHNPSPGLKSAGPEAYAFPYDDSTPYDIGGQTVTPLRYGEFAIGAPLFKIVTCI